MENRRQINHTALWQMFNLNINHTYMSEVWRVHKLASLVANNREDEQTDLHLYNMSQPVLTWSDTKQTVRPQKMARSLKFQIYEAE